MFFKDSRLHFSSEENPGLALLSLLPSNRITRIREILGIVNDKDFKLVGTILAALIRLLYIDDAELDTNEEVV